MNRIIFVSLLLFFVTVNNVSAQIITFSKNHEEFLEQLKDRFEATGDKKDAKIYMDQFYFFWVSPSLTDEYKNLIIDDLNLLVKKKAVPFIHYTAYIDAFRSFIVNEHDPLSFAEWHKDLELKLKSNRYSIRKIKDFLVVTKEQVSRGVIFMTPSLTWTASTKSFRYKYENDTLKAFYANTKIVCFSQRDSVEIKETSGVFIYEDEKWIGESGKITWDRSGFTTDMVYATFGRYTLKMDKPFFRVDSVTFYNKDFFSYPLTGFIEHKVTNIPEPERAVYPKFISYEHRFNIENIHENMNYEGGFSQYGAKFLGSGSEANPAVITIYRNDTLFVTAKSMYFSLKSDQITSNDTEIKIHLDSAFIYHPGLVMRFLTEPNELHLIRTGEGIAKSPYFDTYHNVSMDVELIRWQRDTSIIDLRMLSGAAENYAFFESLSYYRESFYNELQGMDAMHPLQGLKNCSKYFRGQPFTVKDYSEYLRMPENQVRQTVMNLSFYGFIGYNINTDQIEIRDRLNDYLAFRLGQKDYDVIRFNSTTPGSQPNAQLDLINYDLRLNGVSTVSICDHQNVVFFPRNERVLLKQNRNFSFDGIINAGMLNLFGDGFKFSYDQFNIDIKTIDSMRMQVQTGELDYFGKPKMVYVNNTIAQLSGYLQIDEPNNKSGNKTNPQYPILTSNKESFVYYDHPSIQGGAYKKESFFFTLDTFQLDSISALTKKNFDFNGKFTSGIFPPFRDQLTVRDDFSLGFRRQTSPQGFPIYGDKAMFTNTIDLSNRGLSGDGVLNYLKSTSFSENFMFLPDRVTAQVHQFTLEKTTEGVVYPDVKAKFIKIDYVPYEDVFIAKNQEDNFTMYNEEAQLSGELKLEPTGLTGKGKFFMLHGSLVSPAYSFADHSLVADSSDFNLTGTQVEGVSFSTTNLISNVDFETRMGTFVSKGGGSKVEFTDNRYISFINQFSWDMDKNYIYMGAKGAKGNRFVSVHRRQDSLDFYAPLARYDVATKLIEAEDVKNIKVGDANVFLKNGIVRIREDAAMDALDSTTIALNDSLHVLYDARVKIEGKNAYSGYAKYDYYNGENQKQTISMHKFELNDNRQTVAEGNVTNNEFFTFDKHFAYKGKVALNASDTLLSFDGGVQLLHKCESGPKQFVRFESKIDPKNVLVPLNEDLVNFERESIYKDFFLKKDSTHIYSSFLGRRKFYSDIPILTAGGYLHYNNATKSFDIASLQKIVDSDTTGNVMRFNEYDCNVIGEGNIDFGIPLDQFKYYASGTVLDKKDVNDIFLSTLFGVNFFFNDKAILNIVADFNASKAKVSKLSDETFIKRMAEWTGRYNAQKIQNDRTTTGELQSIPVELQYVLTFGNVDWKWNTQTSSYIANGLVDLTFVKNYAVNKEVRLVAEIVRKRSGNSIDLYIEADSENWYYFGYRLGRMETLSSNTIYNDLVQTLSADERKMKTGLGEKNFYFIMAPQGKKERFLKRISKIAASEKLSEEDEMNNEEEEEKDE
ncbi:MAG: hypothetical protein JW717_06435 [Marinilabiliaceae bacterium]|nr:hypothetical protein [Marinilabiliaceae bacterium]